MYGSIGNILEIDNIKTISAENGISADINRQIEYMEGRLKNINKSTDLYQSKKNLSEYVQSQDKDIIFEHEDKQNLKNELKSKISTKFVVGDKYLLQYKNKKLNRTFILKKFIYCVNDEPLNIVIMKQIYGPLSTRYTIGKEDCLKFHIKYEEGLEVFSMGLNWKHLKN